MCKKNYVWNPDTSNCEKEKYLGSTIVDSAVTYNEIKEMELFQQNILLLITVSLLIAVSIYCYLIKYWAKQKHLLPYHVTNNKLKVALY